MFQRRGLILVVNYNQSQEIEKYLNECLLNFSKEQILVVDDGSSDGSDQIAKKMGFQVIRHEINLGIGAAIRTGLVWGLENKYEWILISSSNGKMVPSEFAQVFGPVDRDEVDFVQGSRYLEEDTNQGLPLFRRIAIPAFTAVARILLWTSLTDVTCGLRCYNLKLLSDVRINLNQSWLERYELEYYLLYKFVKVMKVSWKEVPVTIRYGHLAKDRRSKIVPITGWWSMIRPFIFLTLRLRR